MVGDHLTFLQSECQSMVEKEARRDLQNMYKLMKSIENGLHVRFPFFKFFVLQSFFFRLLLIASRSI